MELHLFFSILYRPYHTRANGGGGGVDNLARRGDFVLLTPRGIAPQMTNQPFHGPFTITAEAISRALSSMLSSPVPVERNARPVLGAI